MGLKKIIDMSRTISIVVLALHFYVTCYGVFKAQGWTHPMGDRLLLNIGKTGLFNSLNNTKGIALGFITLSLIGTKGRPEENIKLSRAIIYALLGLFLYFFSQIVLRWPLEDLFKAQGYISCTVMGLLLFIHGGARCSRLLRKQLSGDVFNTLNETFPQEERLIENEYSVNFKTRYKLKNQSRRGYVNIINGFRGTLVMGLTGSGKTRYVVKDTIRQQIEKGYAMFIHDFKYPDLTNVAWHFFQLNKQNFKSTPTFHIINFDEPQERCNPLMVSSIKNISDAASASRAIMLGLNHDWVEKQGDFWVESSINFVTCLIWYLRLYKDGICCTLPHVIELAQTDLDKLFSILRAEPTLEVLVNPFIRAYEEDAGKQLIGQLSGAAVSLGTLSTENLYYILSGNDFTMTLNDAARPKVVCIANNPQISNIYSALISLYLNNLQKLLKEQDVQPTSIILEEFANISWPGVDTFLSVCRSYLVSVTLVIQDASQLTLHYGKRQADVILSMVGNIISGQVTGETARYLSERFGKILQNKESLNINSNDTSVNRAKHLDHAVPQSTIASLSAGEFVGMVADNPDQRIAQKMFHADFIIDEKTLFKTNNQIITKQTDNKAVNDVYLKIKTETKQIVKDQVEKLLNNPQSKSMIVKK